MLKLPLPYRGDPTNNDQWIHRMVFPFKKRGFYVELGAADGVNHSACYLLERIGWQGICVEPCSTFFAALCRNRTKAICEQVCISDHTGLVRFHEDGYLSRVVPNVSRHEFYRQERVVPSLTLKDLLDKHASPKVVDYLAMDIEGMDARVLWAFPFGEYRILAISMEGEADGVLTQNGYVKVRNPFNISCPWESYYLHECFSACSLS